MNDNPIQFPPYPRDPNSIRGRAYRAGATAACGNRTPHDEHVWVQKGKTVPLMCKGVVLDEVDELPLAIRRPHELAVRLIAKGVPLWTTVKGQELMFEGVAEVLDNSLHLEACYIGPDDTRCFCPIGELRKLLPRCEARQGKPWAYQRLTKPKQNWRCLRTVHPSTPDEHVFGDE